MHAEPTNDAARKNSHLCKDRGERGGEGGYGYQVTRRTSRKGIGAEDVGSGGDRQKPDSSRKGNEEEEEEKIRQPVTR